MLKSSFKISHTTTTEFFELIFFPSHQKLWQKYCCEDLSDSSDLLTYWLSISVLTHGFLGIYVTPLFPVYILETNKIWGSSFFPKYPNFYVAFGNAKKNSENIFQFLDNCIWIGCVKHFLLLRENTFYLVAIC